MHANIHSSAIVDDGAHIGPGTRIWHFTHVCAGAQIGADCSLGQNVFVGAAARIGRGVKVQNNVSVYDAVTLEDDVFCGPSVVFTNVYNPRSAIVRKDEYRPTLVRCGASLGANATIVCGVTIGRYSMVAAGAVVKGDTADYSVVAGVPARHIGWISRHGAPLVADADGYATCELSGERYLVHADQCQLLVAAPISSLSQG
jgi:UDP-2-acetamido-3-amino-2,3-dideoxy-glucuronate N-acetyltransferase